MKKYGLLFFTIAILYLNSSFALSQSLSFNISSNRNLQISNEIEYQLDSKYTRLVFLYAKNYYLLAKTEYFITLTEKLNNFGLDFILSTKGLFNLDLAYTLLLKTKSSFIKIIPKIGFGLLFKHKTYFYNKSKQNFFIHLKLNFNFKYNLTKNLSLNSNLNFKFINFKDINLTFKLISLNYNNFELFLKLGPYNKYTIKHIETLLHPSKTSIGFCYSIKF